MPRISGGVLKGRILVVPRHLRPTSEKVRQALFNVLGARIEGARVIDGFAGSGAIGLEALSRGAAEVVFLEHDPDCLKAIGDNATRLAALGEVPGAWRVIPGNAFRGLKTLAQQGRTFDCIVLDPPYRSIAPKKALNTVAEYAMLAPTGMLCVEHVRQSELPSSAGLLTLAAQHRYGDTVLSFYTHGHTSRLSRDV
jgi:16S rRNA (guanine(966)-N(2))-methyltransferase RsmD